MTAFLGRGECGGHITLLFTVSDESDDPIEQGSLGAGLCVEDGVEVIAYGEEGESGLSVRFVDDQADSMLYEEVLRMLIEEVPEVGDVSWEINVRLALPTSQGFGMSGSGAIAAAMAFQRAMGLPHEESLRRSYSLAHRVERARSTGLGDVTALAAGGVERRLVAGSPYHGALLENGPGRAEGWTSNTPVVLAWRPDTGKHTSNYIDDAHWKDSISEAGYKQMERLSLGDWDQSRWMGLMDAARAFAEDSGLLADSSRTELLSTADEAIGVCGTAVEAAALLCMLGESVVIVPTNPEDEGEGLSTLVSELKRAGLEATLTRVGELS